MDYHTSDEIIGTARACEESFALCSRIEHYLLVRAMRSGPFKIERGFCTSLKPKLQSSAHGSQYTPLLS